MGFERRKKEILSLLAEKEFITASDLVQRLGVSDITIRRDLSQLESLGLLKRTHGGATRVDENPMVSFDLKSSQNEAEKRKIGEAAAKHIQDGDVIFIDCGSTTLHICLHIRKLNIKVITNSLPVVSALQNSKVKVNLIGGELANKRQAVHGKMAVNHIHQYHADIAFIGADAIDLEGNLWANSETEAEISSAMIAASNKVYVCADSSKRGRKGYLKFSDSTAIEQIVS
ncbi:DeoR/GlpR family DNA-binding transcription regulator [Arcticibacterium luteifluviistationis]|uniref:DeoR/GlpR transcriptional regulator n=1 Tax=Arcticibacterium luteifluviistationis TaxID=1784714 RepID=A0A2Z4GF76_9BACT|nr:DeoR/GlpR family DNA-binding transcription regulator [Arcticibacterium luteifluviistationis]AWV99695.1 DeoR/GlpR transcriptional regulator [Arcticibacterium luteifluviistationis]